jgi:alkylated DNA repair dioxygenase AlkB
MSPKRRVATEPPAGFVYVDDAISAVEESALVALMGTLPWEAVVFRGIEARRRVVHFGHRYDYEARGVSPGLPIPQPLSELRERLAPLAGREAERFVEVLATEYRPGTSIGWHRDAPAFGSVVMGVSLGSACRMRFRRSIADGWERWERTLEPRSAYVIGGAARASWQHSIPPTPDLRYSITYRTVRAPHQSST